jgi:hypothetical protein
MMSGSPPVNHFTAGELEDVVAGLLTVGVGVFLAYQGASHLLAALLTIFVAI